MLYVAWDFFYWHYLYEEPITAFLRDWQTGVSSKLLSLFGFNTYVYGNNLYIDGENCILVANQCNGLDFGGVFLCFIFAYPAPIKQKLYFIPLGLAVVFGLNIIRISGLALNFHYSKGSFEFNHKITFTYVVYILVFAAWYGWTRLMDRLGVK